MASLPHSLATECYQFVAVTYSLQPIVFIDYLFNSDESVQPTPTIADPSVRLLVELLRRPSVTPDDAGCQALIAARLKACGFICEVMRFGAVTNLWARRGTGAPLFCFAGHTDVVPPGERERWTSGPFEPELRGDNLYGRGGADCLARQ